MDKNSVSEKLKVFVSYSRRDLAFTDQLVSVLAWQGFAPIIDREGIHGAEKWDERLGQLILESDIIVFVLSPDSATSDVCRWEVDEALRRGKRIVPIVCRPLDGNAPHKHLRDLNYIHFYPDKDTSDSGFGTGLVKLIAALSVDIEWVREHTRLEELATRWHENHRNNDLLVRGSELAAFGHWRDRRPSNASELTTLQRAFISASENEEDLRENTERKRLAEIDAAQNERQAAIEQREAAVQRERQAQNARAKAKRIITWGSITAGAVMIVGTVAFAAEQRSNANEQARLRDEALIQKAQIDELVGRIRVGGSKDAGIAAMRLTCDEAVSVTWQLATATGNDSGYGKLEQRFWQLYWGPMNLIEIRQRTANYNGNSDDIVSSSIESAMVKFGRELQQQSSSQANIARSELRQTSQVLKQQCDQYLS